MSGAAQIITLENKFSMHRGGELENVQVALETWGEPNERRDNSVLIFTGLSPSAHATSSPEDPSSGWWESIVGPDFERIKYTLTFGNLGLPVCNMKAGGCESHSLPSLSMGFSAMAVDIGRGASCSAH